VACHIAAAATHAAAMSAYDIDTYYARTHASKRARRAKHMRDIAYMRMLLLYMLLCMERCEISLNFK
ncbi:MAG: hypothetical protein ACLRS8_14625, partial [Parabacteroides merdae]